MESFKTQSDQRSSMPSELSCCLVLPRTPHTAAGTAENSPHCETFRAVKRSVLTLMVEKAANDVAKRLNMRRAPDEPLDVAAVEYQSVKKSAKYEGVFSSLSENPEQNRRLSPLVHNTGGKAPHQLAGTATNGESILFLLYVWAA